MTLPDIESEALKLSRAERARLAESLLESLDDLTDDEHERLWVDEAKRRDQEFEQGLQQGKPAEVVFRQLRARVG